MHPALKATLFKGVSPLVDLNFRQGAYKVGQTRSSAFTAAALPGLTITRASVGYAETASGLLVPFASGEARITDKGLLVEEQRTNLLLRSQEFDNAAWTKVGGTIAANAAVAPDGSTTADALIEGTGTVGPTVYQAVTVANATPYTGSCFVKRGAGSRNFSLRMEAPTAKIAVFDFDAVSVVSVTAGATATITALAGGWFRVSITTTSTSAGTAYLQPQMISGTTYATYTGDGASSFYLWGAQLEAGSFTSSDIPTTTAAVTRESDVVVVTGIAGLLTGTILAEATAVNAVAENGAGGVSPSVCSITDGVGGANSIIIYRAPTTNFGQFRARVGGVDQANFGAVVWGNGARKRFAARYQTNDFATSTDGLAVETGVSGDVPTGLTTMHIGMNRAASQGFWNGYIGRIVVPSRVYSDAQLQAWGA